MQGVFVTGTGTGVGKTVAAATVAHTFSLEGKDVKVFKPVVTGLDEPGEPDYALLRRGAGSTQSDEEIAPYRYGPPVSPHLAAALAGEEIERDRLLEAAKEAKEGADAFICEGVGGLMVPLNLNYLVRDLILDLAMPVAIAADPGLGTINHTLLTIEAARAAGLRVTAVVLTPWPETPSRLQESNRETIALFGGVEVATVPPLDLEDLDSWPTEWRYLGLPRG